MTTSRRGSIASSKRHDRGDAAKCADDREDETEGAGEMTDPIPFRPVDESIQRRQLADGAHELLNNKAFTTAILELRKRWFAIMMDSTDDAPIGY